VAPSPFAELLQRHRHAARLSQQELARLSGLSERAISGLERGATARPRRHSARAVATALDLTGTALTTFLPAAQGDGPAVAAPPAEDLVGRGDPLRGLAELVTVGRRRIITVTGPRSPRWPAGHPG
jgi:transcriptional regulator with XRE-family HTH domain